MNSTTGAFTAASTNPRGKARHRICALLSEGFEAPLPAFYPLCIITLVQFKQGNGRYNHELASTDLTKVLPIPSIAETAFLTANPEATFQDYITWLQRKRPEHRAKLSKIRAMFIQDLKRTLAVQQHRLELRNDIEHEDLPPLEQPLRGKRALDGTPPHRPEKRSRFNE